MTNTVAVPVQSAWYSKINWTQIVGTAINLAAYGASLAPPQWQAPLAIVIQAATSAATWYFKTYATTTITPSSAKVTT